MPYIPDSRPNSLGESAAWHPGILALPRGCCPASPASGTQRCSRKRHPEGGARPRAGRPPVRPRELRPVRRRPGSRLGPAGRRPRLRGAGPGPAAPRWALPVRDIGGRVQAKEPVVHRRPHRFPGLGRHRFSRLLLRGRRGVRLGWRRFGLPGLAALRTLPCPLSGSHLAPGRSRGGGPAPRPAPSGATSGSLASDHREPESRVRAALAGRLWVCLRHPVCVCRLTWYLCWCFGATCVVRFALSGEGSLFFRMEY